MYDNHRLSTIILSSVRSKTCDVRSFQEFSFSSFNSLKTTIGFMYDLDSCTISSQKPKKTPNNLRLCYDSHLATLIPVQRFQSFSIMQSYCLTWSSVMPTQIRACLGECLLQWQTQSIWWDGGGGLGGRAGKRAQVRLCVYWTCLGPKRISQVYISNLSKAYPWEAGPGRRKWPSIKSF